MKIIKYFIILSLIIILFNCKKSDSTDSKTDQDNKILKLSEKELMKKYGTKDLTQEETTKIINSIKWTINKNNESLGSKKAKKSGELRGGSAFYPPSLRTVGENSRTAFISTLSGLIYESLLGLHPITLEYVPGLADKWSITDDKKTYYFHVDKRAKWQDGMPVTAYDYVATWDLLVCDGIKDPFSQDFWNKYERPVALSSEIIMVKPKSLEWRLFLSASGMSVFPEHIIGRITPEEYMQNYNDKMMVGSGPYFFDKAKTNQYIVFKKDENWWGIKLSENKGLYNFNTLKFIFYTEESLLDEKFLKGEIDILGIRMARKWIQKYTPENYSAIKYNHIIKQKIYNHEPIGLSGYMFNIRKEPFNDKRIRKAIYMLYNRENMMDKLFFNQYEYMDSYYTNSPNENKNNVKIRYNPDEAVRLLEEAGYSQDNLNAEGYFVKNGKPFEININTYDSDTRIETILQEELENVGIKLNIKRVTWATHIKDINERNFKMIGIAYTGSIFPYPESSFHSKFADKLNTSNIWGFKNKRVDEICEEYNYEYNIKNRIKLLQELDNILTNEFITTFNWHANYDRLLYWNKFDMPDFVISRFTIIPSSSIFTYWWHDKDAVNSLKKAKGKEIELPGRPKEVKYWDKY